MLALLPVFVVNLGGFASGAASGPLVPATPTGTATAQMAAFVAAALFQAKGYPLLAFLFGYSIALTQRRGCDPGQMHEAQRHRRARMRRLLAIGIAHGLLLYWGDVLTLYATAGLLLAARSQRRLGHLWKLAKISLAASIAMTIGFVVLLPSADTSLPPPPAHALEAWSENARLYLLNTVGMVVYLPSTLALMLAGLVAGRLRLLTHRRWLPALRLTAARLLPVALTLNLAWAAVISFVPTEHWPAGLNMDFLVEILGPLLVIGAVAALAASWHRGRARLLRHLAPVGRYSLSIYLGCSLIGVIAIGPLGLHRQPPTVALLLGALLAWAALLATGMALARRDVALPLERWLSKA